ncbi:MAG: phosphatase PAP2 family protein [Promethearchaeota archaeon]
MKKIEKKTRGQFIALVICVVLIAIFLLTPTLFEFTYNQALRELLPGAEYFFKYITELGGTLLYMGVFLVIFWGIDKNIAKSLSFVYVGSNFVNYYAKAIIANPRPDQSNWILIGAGHLSTPSGHAMSSTVFWGYIAMRFKRWFIWIISTLIFVLVGLSRIYLGVHWLGDVLTGWLFGMVILLIAWMLENPLQSFLEERKMIYIYLGLAVFGLVMIIFTECFFPSESYHFGTPGGQLIGLGIGFALEHKYVNFEINFEPGKKWKLMTRVFLGVIIYAVVFLGLYLIIDTDIFWLSAIHYIVTLVTGIFVWPYIFKKVGL